MRLKWSILFLFCLAPNLAFAIDEPHRNWEEIESEHFIIHFPSDQALFARRAIAIAEEAHAKLVPMLEWTPSGKTHLSVIDKGDEANGSATPVPRNEIRLFPVPPAISEELGHFDDWMRQLIYHEYTHILHTDTSSGLHPVINAVFGKFARNNATTPRWYAEGLAVFYETRMSNAGRLRNTLYKTMMFNAARDRAIPTLGELNAEQVRWPGGSAYYLYGSHLIAYISKTYGLKSLTRWNHEYGDDWIPYAMNRAALKIWNKTWDELYESWRQQAFHDAQDKLKHAQNITPHTAVTKPWRNMRPEMRGSDLIYVRNDGYHPKSIVAKNLDSGREDVLAECWGRCEHHLNAAGDTLYFTHNQGKDGYAYYETLFAYDFSTRNVAKIDMPNRIRSFSVDGAFIYSVIQVRESQEIHRYAMETGKDEIVLRGAPFEQFEDIAVRDGVIAVSIFSPKNQSVDLHIIENGDRIPLTDDRAAEYGAFWLRDGRIGYISDASGELNLWAIEPSTKIRTRLTHLFDGILHPSEAENGDIYYTQYTSSGTAIARIDAENLHSYPLDVHEDDGLVMHYPELVPDASAKRPYRPWHWLWPQTWLPRLNWSETSRAAVGLSFSGSDLLDHHAFSFTLDYLSGKDAVDFSLNYAWTSLLWDLNFDVGLSQTEASYRDNLKVKRYDYQVFYGGVSATRVLNGRVWSQSVRLGARLEYSQPLDPLSWSKNDPAAMPPALPNLGWHNALTARYSVGNMHSTERAVSSNDGYSMQASLRFEAPWLGAQAYAVQATLTAAAAWTMPWLASHQFNLKLSGGTSWSQHGDQPFTLSSASGILFTSADVMLHGYPSGLVYGRHYLYGHAAYSAPIVDIEAGHSTLPIGITRLSASVFGDWGYAWADNFDITRSKGAVGANLFLDLQLGYRLPVRLTLGYARGVSPHGGNAFYLLWAY